MEPDELEAEVCAEDGEGRVRGYSLSVWEKTATRSAQMSKKPNQTEARRREPTSISHHPSAGTPFFLPSAAMPVRQAELRRNPAHDRPHMGCAAGMAQPTKQSLAGHDCARANPRKDIYYEIG